MHIRRKYLDVLLKHKNTPLIKVVTGMRRVGKSVLVQQLIDHINENEPKSNCIYINKEDMSFDHIRHARDLNDYVNDILVGQTADKYYLFVDEVQEIEEWQKAISSLLSKGNIDIYITGSNAHLLSSELATLISGRYIEIQIYSFSYEEFLAFREDNDKNKPLNEYLRFGGIPVLHHMEFVEEVAYPYLNSLWNTILLKDIVSRYEVRNIDLLQRVAQFTFDNIGNILSAKAVADYLKSQRIKVGVETIQNYLHYIASTYAIHKVPRYDIKGKRFLEFYEKYYLGDIGLKHAHLGYRESDISGILENIVFLELKRRGYDVSIGKIGDLEIDFIAVNPKRKIYIQVSYLLASPETVNRECEPLFKIKDSYPKWIISLDQHLGDDIEGIKRWYLPDFLLSKDF
ncbi:ATP-binding protein [Candidatus Margulisiibacteriota bacterium]